MDRNDVVKHINDLHMDSLPIVITYEHGAYAIVDTFDYPAISDVTDDYMTHTNDRGYYAGQFAGFDLYEYHASYVAPQARNHDWHLDDLEAGDIARLIVAVEPLDETWVFAVRAEES